MPDYKDWTLALYQALLANRAAEESIYLQIDSLILEDIATQAWPDSLPEISWQADFIWALKRHLADGKKLDVSVLQDRYLRPAQPHEQAQGLKTVITRFEPTQLKRQQINSLICPLSLGFLVFQVLVASQMRHDEEHTGGNYYSRLEQVLEGLTLPTSQRSLVARLWHDFNDWLRLRAWIPTAKEGQGPNRFVQLPVSQSLLRQSDQQKLHQLMHQSCQRNQTMSPERLNGWLIQHQNQLTSHLQKTLELPDPQLHSELQHEIYAFYLDRSWLEEPGSHRQGQQRRLKAGLYRFENFFTEELEFRLYPEMRRLQNYSGGLNVIYQGQANALIYHRPGFYQPLNIAIQNPGRSQSFEIQGHQSIQELVFTGSDCWALVPDPLAPESHIYASWRRPVPGEAFLFLCLKDYHGILCQLKQAGLLDWESEPYELQNLKDASQQSWYEYHGMQILEVNAQRWLAQKLPSELQYWLLPQQEIGLAIQGGLPTRGSREYLTGLPLKLKILASEGSYHVSLNPLSGSKDLQPASSFEQSANQIFELALPQAGCYELRIIGPGGSHTQNLNLIDWQDLQPRQDGFERYTYELDEEGKLFMEGGHIWHV